MQQGEFLATGEGIFALSMPPILRIPEQFLFAEKTSLEWHQTDL